MSIITAVHKGNTICISADTQSSFGSTKLNSSHIENYTKIHKINNSYIGITGWTAIEQIILHLAKRKPEMFVFNSCDEIFDSLIKLQEVMKKDYYLETKQERDKDEQPVESNHLNAMIINKNGIFEIDSFREVHKMKNFWAVGCGQDFAIGAMHTVYKNKNFTARKIAEAGVRAACEFNDSCSLPLESKIVRL